MSTYMDKYQVGYVFASGLDKIETMRCTLTVLDALLEIDELNEQDVTVSGCSVTFTFTVVAEDKLHAMIKGLMELHNAILKTSWALSLSPAVITSSAKMMYVLTP